MKRFFNRLVSLWKHTDKEVSEAEARALATASATEGDASFHDTLSPEGAGYEAAGQASSETSNKASKKASRAGLGDKSAELMATRACTNCGEVLTGPYCFSCGQKVGDIRRPIWSLLSELLDNVVAPDSKLLKTMLLLLAVPGGLTRDYNRGMRARFIPPLRFYITITFLFFALVFVTDVLILDIRFTYVGNGEASVEAAQAEPQEDLRKDLQEGPGEALVDAAQTSDFAAPPLSEITEQSADPPAAEAPEPQAKEDDNSATGLGAIGFSDVTLEKIKARVGDVRSIKSSELTDEERAELLESFERGLPNLPPIAINAIKRTIENGDADVRLTRNPFDFNFEVDGDDIDFEDGSLQLDRDDFPYDVSVDMFVKRTADARETIRPEDLESWITDDDMPEFAKDAMRGFSEAVADPREFNDLFNDLLPRLLFFMVPLFALILRLFHWGNKRFYFNQLIFSLHFHSFLFLIFIAFIFVLPVINGAYGFEMFWWGTSLYLVIALKIGQEQGWLRAFLKAGFIWVSYAVMLAITLLVSVIVGLSGRGLYEVIESAQVSAQVG